LERVYPARSTRKAKGGEVEGQRCERCGKPVKVGSDDYDRGELLCPSCALESSTPGNDVEETE